MIRRSVEEVAGRRAELSEFLRVRRARLQPDDVGVVAGDRRRTPGLRREEVAVLAGVGVSWYTWLEQGRDINVSDEVLDAISRALRLNDVERAHLYLLAGHNSPVASTDADEDVDPDLLRLVEAWAPRPALVHDRYWNVLAINEGTRAIFGYGELDRNCLISFFTNERYRGMYREWTSVAPAIVAAFRADAAHFPGDPGFTAVVDRLRATSPEFVELWARHDVGLHAAAVKAVLHPEAGGLFFEKVTLVPPAHPDWRVELYNPQSGTGTEARLEDLLGSGAVRASG